MTEWLNAPYNAYVQYTHELDPQAVFLINKYGWFFDDEFFYWIPKRNQAIMKRAPIWLYPQRGLNGQQMEKSNAIKPPKSRFNEKQRKLVEIIQ